ncbi:unnamed protein product [Nippostrongylus brasiliensis]|uniref:Fibronectin type-III domain-containing protein n=1 Tax=Nippostrongylus brasiliensis TaxID=27835 RepID=A0A0N4YQZ4_NIPBR|nr:unnamed protein product [Nippostrongylus brasiliensis]
MCLVRNADKELKSFTTRDYALDLVLDHRPTTYEVKVCTWYVNRTGHCSETGHIAVPELAPEDPPEKISVDVLETGAISVDFLPPRVNKLIGTLLRCTVALCTGRVVTSECLTKTVPITSTHRLSVQFDDPESASEHHIPLFTNLRYSRPEHSYCVTTRGTWILPQT